MPQNIRYWGPAKSYDEAIERLVKTRGPVAVDTETIALSGVKNVDLDDFDEDGEPVAVKAFMDARTCIGVGIAISPDEAFYFPVGNPAWANVPECDLSPVYQVLTNPNINKIFFNSMFDIDRLDNTLGIDCSGNFDDVAIACQVQGLWNALDQNVGKLLGIDHMVIEDVLPKGKTMLDVPFEVTSQKCIWDCIDTLKLANLMNLRGFNSDGEWTWEDHLGRQYPVTDKIKDCYRVDKALLPVLRKMTARGFQIRADRVNEWDERYTREIKVYDDYFSSLGYNVGSNDQVGWLLAKRGNYIGRTDSGKHLKVDEEILLNVGQRDPIAYMVLARRRRKKFRSTYVERFIGLERAYSHFRFDLATGRLGSYNFNSQNIPPVMRSIFAPESGIWSWADLNQAEMRVWAWQAQDEVMLKAFAENSSPHVATLNYLFPGVKKSIHTGDYHEDGSPVMASTPQYVDSKSYNFALLADASAQVLARTTKKSVEECQYLKNQLYALYWKSKQHQDYMRQRHRPVNEADWVEDDYGRRCHIPDLSIHTEEHHQEKCRLNYPFQATVASAVKRIMLGLNAMGLDMAVQVHDEILVNGDVEFPKWMSQVHPAINMPFEVERKAIWS